MLQLFVNFDINKLSTDEEITLLLGTRIIRDLALANVIYGIDPFSIEPPNSSGEWYLYNSEAPQYSNRGSAITKTESGFWRIKDDYRIFTYTDCVGRKTIMEFYIGKVPNGNKTLWRMHQYVAEKKTFNGFCNNKGFTNSLYRVFLLNDQTDYGERHCSSSAGCECAKQLLLPILQKPPSRDVLNRSLGQSASSGSVRERLNENVTKDINATWDLFTEDYVELNDFYNPEHAKLSVSVGEHRQPVYSERQSEPYSDEDYLELNDICSPVTSSELAISADERQSTCSESISESLNENTVKDPYAKNNFSNEEELEVKDLCSPETSSSSDY